MHTRSPLRSRRGASAVELALGSLPLLLILSAVADWGWFFSRQMVLGDAVRDAALAASLAGSEDDPVTIAETRVEASLKSMGFDSADLDITAAVTTDGDVEGELIQLDVEVGWAPVAGLVPVPEQLRASSTFLLLNS